MKCSQFTSSSSCQCQQRTVITESQPHRRLRQPRTDTRLGGRWLPSPFKMQRTLSLGIACSPSAEPALTQVTCPHRRIRHRNDNIMHYHSVNMQFNYIEHKHQPYMGHLCLKCTSDSQVQGISVFKTEYWRLQSHNKGTQLLCTCVWVCMRTCESCV